MADAKGFLKVKRYGTGYRPVCERVKDFAEVAPLRPDDRSREQASRCMDCGTPFCHGSCPVGNHIPEWNDALYRGQWSRAWDLLSAANPLPEITGRLCPALCEYSCVLGINDDPVTIRENELSIVEHAFAAGLVKPRPPEKRTSKTVGIIGSGPAGLACADLLNRAGHTVTVYERDDRPGGILRYGIPDFKLDKSVIDRRVALMTAEGIAFKMKADVGGGLSVEDVRSAHDALCLTGGSRVPRDLAIEGRATAGIYFAMDYLIQSNIRVAGSNPAGDLIDARGKNVVVIGGGDTGADCVGTAHRQGAACVTQIEIMPKPPSSRSQDYPWPRYPLLLKTTSSHEEGGERQWSILTKRFAAENGRLRGIQCVRVEFDRQAGRAPAMREVPGTGFEIPADMVVLALGFVHPEKGGMVRDLGLELDERGNLKTDHTYMTSLYGVFAAGDMRRGQSLIVWAVNEGRSAAFHIDEHLRGGPSVLPRP